jgi:hypothetical protein
MLKYHVRECHALLDVKQKTYPKVHNLAQTTYDFDSEPKVVWAQVPTLR